MVSEFASVAMLWRIRLKIPPMLYSTKEKFLKGKAR
jgi:hypothetical protein